MASEIEVKVLNINTKQLIKKLQALGAKQVLKTRLVVDWFRLKGVKEGEDEWFLRIRSDSSGNSEVTWKAKSKILGKSRKHKEINFKIEDPGIVSDFFESIDLENYAHQEKDRISYVYKDWKIDIDQYPDMPAYVEIEGRSEKHILKGLDLFDLSENETSSEGERTLIQNTYNLDWYSMEFK